MLRAIPVAALLAAILSVGASFPGGAAAETRTASKPHPVPFDRARGTLPWPVAGVQIVSFGQPTRKNRRSRGIVIEAPLGARVVSPCNGMIVYAGEFMDYGTLVIVSAGNGYHCLLSGPLSTDAQVGQKVSPGDPIGVLAGSEMDGAPPRLRLELLKHQRPIDPAPWLRRS